MSKFQDLTGQTFGYLTVLGINDINPKHGYRWKCKCICGNETLVYTDGLRSGHSKSCGCMRSLLIHLKIHPEYEVFEHLIDEQKYITINDYITKPYYIIGTLPSGETFKISKEDYQLVAKYNWVTNRKGYVVTKMSSKGVQKPMHRMILECPTGFVIDHINHDVKDNRRENLRLATLSQNMINKRREDIDHIPGVHQNKQGKWYARIQVNGIKYHLGTYDLKDDAIKARLAAEEEYFGDYSYANSMMIASSFD